MHVAQLMPHIAFTRAAQAMSHSVVQYMKALREQIVAVHIPQAESSALPISQMLCVQSGEEQ